MSAHSVFKNKASAQTSKPKELGFDWHDTSCLSCMSLHMHANKDDMQYHEHVVSQSGLCMRLQLPETLFSAVLASGSRLASGVTSDELAAS